MNNASKEYSDDQYKLSYRVGYLIAGYINNTLTEAEKDELDDWVTQSDENMELFAELTREETIEKGLKERGIYDADKAVELLKQKIKRKKRGMQMPFLAVGIAASILLVVGVYFFTSLFNKKQGKPNTTVATTDLPPGGDKAILTLADGKRVVLDNATNGTIAIQGNTQITKGDGTLAYNQQGEAVSAQNLVYNTVSTPKGGQYQLTLADGSKVWLNAASSIHFPTAFTEKERTVEITGEAYFEVAHDGKKPFRVHILRHAQDDKPIQVEVLGTHFNVNGYSDEPGVKTTLLEGSVKVSADNQTMMIKPGQQAIFSDKGELSKKNVDDADRIIAWKNGIFEFKDEPIESIMRQVARWYDVSVKYEGKPTDHFNASISRNVPVSKLFHLLELTDRVHFTIEDKAIVVKP